MIHFYLTFLISMLLSISGLAGKNFGTISMVSDSRLNQSQCKDLGVEDIVKFVKSHFKLSFYEDKVEGSIDELNELLSSDIFNSLSDDAKTISILVFYLRGDQNAALALFDIIKKCKMSLDEFDLIYETSHPMLIANNILNGTMSFNCYLESKRYSKAINERLKYAMEKNAKGISCGPSYELMLAKNQYELFKIDKGISAKLDLYSTDNSDASKRFPYTEMNGHQVLVNGGIANQIMNLSLFIKNDRETAYLYQLSGNGINGDLTYFRILGSFSIKDVPVDWFAVDSQEDVGSGIISMRFHKQYKDGGYLDIKTSPFIEYQLKPKYLN